MQLTREKKLAILTNYRR